MLIRRCFFINALIVESKSLTVPRKNSIIKLKYTVSCCGRYGFKRAPANMDAHSVAVDTAAIVSAEAIGLRRMQGLRKKCLL